MLPSYPSIFALGHREIAQLLDGEVVVEEKVDGSQLSFGVIDGQLQMRSKGQEINLDAPPKMFEAAVGSIRSRADNLIPGWVYRGEYLSKPKHNTLCYDRTPRGYVALFDVEIGPGDYLSPAEKVDEADRIGVDVVPWFHWGRGDEVSRNAILSFLDQDSFLGGVRIEGVVIKNYDLFTRSKHVAIGKFVSEAFKEVHHKDWKNRHPSGKDVISRLADTYRTEARWQKAIQHLREKGLLQDAPQDIGLLLKEINEDVLRECGDEIKEVLFKQAWKDISRGITKGFPEWYRDKVTAGALSGV